jgi:hypothetical protein
MPPPPQRVRKLDRRTDLLKSKTALMTAEKKLFLRKRFASSGIVHSHVMMHMGWQIWDDGMTGLAIFGSSPTTIC